MSAPIGPTTEAATAGQAIAHATRLLMAAEAETDRGLMERYERLADSWTAIAVVQTQREQLV